VGKIKLRNLSRLFRYLGNFTLLGRFQLHHRCNCCSHQYNHQLQLELGSYRTERTVIISIGTDRNILLFVVSELLCGENLSFLQLE
jgi:hypothetical protein